MRFKPGWLVPLLIIVGIIGFLATATILVPVVMLVLILALLIPRWIQKSRPPKAGE